MIRPLRESDIEKYLVKRVKELGGECRKIQFIGRPGAPDRLVMLPERFIPGWQNPDAPLGQPKWAYDRTIESATIWVELKAPGKKAEPHQVREHERMRKMGQRVVVIDSYEGVEELFK